MNENSPLQNTSRREFIKTTGKFAAASALAGVALPQVHAATGDAIQIALVGCGGRGTGAAANAMSTNGGPVKLVAMADVFQDRLDSSHNALQSQHAKTVDVPQDRRFLGFDGYKKALDCLKPGDVAIFTTPPAFRWAHFTYAIEKGLNVFMEKPVAVDPVGIRSVITSAKKAEAIGLNVVTGTQRRHQEDYIETYKII